MQSNSNSWSYHGSYHQYQNQTHQIYPGMINRVPLIFGLSPEEYNQNLLAQQERQSASFLTLNGQNSFKRKIRSEEKAHIDLKRRRQW